MLIYTMPNGAQCIVPGKRDVERLAVGDYAPNILGDWREIVKIAYAGVNPEGRAYVGYEVALEEGATLTASMVADEAIPTIPLCRDYRISDINALIAQGLSPNGATPINR